MDKTYSCIVIGGGMAGISACNKLLESGVKNILLLEASDRLGGRINTIPLQNSFIDMGAQWIQGRKGNPVYEIAKSLNLLDHKTITEFGDVTYYVTQDGKLINQDYAEKIYDKVEQIFESVEKKVDNDLDEKSDRSLQSLLDEKFRQYLQNQRFDPHERALVEAIYKCKLNDEKIDDACDLNLLSAVGWNEYDDLDGIVYNNLKSGYGGLLQHLIENISNESIRLDEPVEQIHWNNNNTVDVTSFSIRRNAHNHYRAQTVLCTIPLGCLKQTHQHLFQPNLPRDKITAIERMGFGVVDKIYLIFDRTIFKDDVQGVQILWRNDLHFQLDDRIVRKWNLNSANDFYKMIDNFNVEPLLRNVAVTFVAGPEAVFMESLDDECLIDIFNDLFSRCLAGLHMPKLLRIVRSKWSRNQFARGSYSFVHIGSSIEDNKALIKPLNNKVFFAGEATHTSAYGSVHGAYETGRNAATKIVQSLKK